MSFHRSIALNRRPRCVCFWRCEVGCDVKFALIWIWFESLCLCVFEFFFIFLNLILFILIYSNSSIVNRLWLKSSEFQFRLVLNSLFALSQKSWSVNFLAKPWQLECNCCHLCQLKSHLKQQTCWDSFNFNLSVLFSFL